MSMKVLGGRRYLIVEDEYLIASSVISALEAAGARVFGPVSDIERALEVVGVSGLAIDGAVLDVNLHGEMVYPAAAVLTEQNVPFIFVTGYEGSSIPPQFAHAPCLTKPCDHDQLISLLASMSQPVGA